MSRSVRQIIKEAVIPFKRKPDDDYAGRPASPEVVKQHEQVLSKHGYTQSNQHDHHYLRSDKSATDAIHLYHSGWDHVLRRHGNNTSEHQAKGKGHENLDKYLTDLHK